MRLPSQHFLAALLTQMPSMKPLVALAFAVSLSPSLALSQALSVPTRFGTLTGPSSEQITDVLRVNKRPVFPDTKVDNDASLVGKFVVGDTDVILINVPAGNRCPGQYVFVTLKRDDARASNSFGTCVESEIKPVLSGSTITFTMPKLKGSGETKFVYANGSITENGKPVK
jgi:hypothetical protein